MSLLVLAVNQLQVGQGSDSLKIRLKYVPRRIVGTNKLEMTILEMTISTEHVSFNLVNSRSLMLPHLFSNRDHNREAAGKLVFSLNY